LKLSFLIAACLRDTWGEGKREDANNNTNSHRFQGISIKSGKDILEKYSGLIVEMKENTSSYRSEKGVFWGIPACDAGTPSFFTL
jgi:hypothetical protein